VDAYHAIAHLGDLARAVWGPTDPHVAPWVRWAKAVLLGRGAGALLPHLRHHRPAAAHDPDRLRREQGYFAANAARMAYPTFTERGLPMGSGAIESAAHHVVQQRLKQPGMRWSQPGAQVVLAVLAHRASGRPLPTVRPHVRRPVSLNPSARRVA
jgi:hypothetical protein